MFQDASSLSEASVRRKNFFLGLPGGRIAGGGFFWLQALVQKYLAAIAAANGEKELAELYFSKASALLEQEIDDNIIAFIRMTVLAEAYRSLEDQRFRQAALDSFGP